MATIYNYKSSSQFTSLNPILSNDVIGVETDTNKYKIGNGLLNWLNLPYVGVISVINPSSGTQLQIIT
jgi:hypothetical protein